VPASGIRATGVRGALGGLTTRGRCFLAAGLAASVTAVVLGQPSILRVGLLLAAVPLLGALAVTRSQYRLSCTRKVEPARIAAGGTAVVTLRLDNLSRVRTGVLLAEDRVPYVLGSRPRFVLDRVESRGQRAVGYQVRSEVRGRFVLGPLGVRLGDPFGMCELQRAFTATDTLTVTPVVVPLPAVPLDGALAGSGTSTARSVAAAGEDDVSTREYRHGDALHRVHWRSTARRGELMVRREEQPWQSRATLLLDVRAQAHRGEGPHSSFERAVSAVASIGVHLSERGFAVRLVQLGGSEPGRAHAGSAVVPAAVPIVGDLPMRPDESRAALLDTLAVVTPLGGDHLALGGLGSRGAGDVLVIAVLAGLTREEALAVTSAPGAAGSRRGRLALVLDVDAWATSGTAHSAGAGHAAGADHLGGTGHSAGTAHLGTTGHPGAGHIGRPWHRPTHETSEAVAVLADAGWRVSVVGPETPFTEAWAALVPTPPALHQPADSTLLSGGAR
jgi:hypothetical protein